MSRLVSSMWNRSKSNLDSVIRRSDNIFSIFTKTKEDCENLNNEIAGVVKAKEDEIQGLQSEVNALNAVKAKNTSLASKISTFLNS